MNVHVTNTASKSLYSYVQPRLYLAGSDRDVEVNPAANIAIVTAGALAIAAIASGLVINFQSKPRGKNQLHCAIHYCLTCFSVFHESFLCVVAAPIEDVAGEYLTLSQYKDKFSAAEAPALK